MVLRHFNSLFELLAPVEQLIVLLFDTIELSLEQLLVFLFDSFQLVVKRQLLILFFAVLKL